MKHQITLDPETNIAYVKIVGFGDDEVAREFVNKANNVLIANQDKRVNCIIDMSDSGESTLAGIEVYKKFIADERLGKLAFVRTGAIVRALVQLATQKKDPDQVNFFDTEEEAKAWILA